MNEQLRPIGSEFTIAYPVSRSSNDMNRYEFLYKVINHVPCEINGTVVMKEEIVAIKRTIKNETF